MTIRIKPAEMQERFPLFYNYIEFDQFENISVLSFLLTHVSKKGLENTKLDLVANIAPLNILYEINGQENELYFKVLEMKIYHHFNNKADKKAIEKAYGGEVKKDERLDTDEKNGVDKDLEYKIIAKTIIEDY
jgi:hypothetical protein